MASGQSRTYRHQPVVVQLVVFNVRFAQSKQIFQMGTRIEG